jgi:superfamily II DNA helicase RecQ
VALSRCRTLEGLTLSTPLSAGVAFEDHSVSQFVSCQPTFEQTSEAAGEYERQYRLDKLMELFGMDDLVRLAERLQEHYSTLKNIYPEQLTSLNNHISKLLDLQSVSEKFKAQLMRLDEQQQNDRARKGAEYYLAQLALFNSQLPALLDVEIDNKETKKNVEESGKELSGALKVKTSCLRTVKEKGYSVQAVQKAKVDAMMDSEKKSTKSSKPAKLSGSEDINTDLATLLRQWRAAKAKEEGLPIYMVLQQKALQSIATNAPRTPAELKRQLGVGPKTVEKYGIELLSIVAEYLDSGQQFDEPDL